MCRQQSLAPPKQSRQNYFSLEAFAVLECDAAYVDSWHRRFGTTYRSHPQESSSARRILVGLFEPSRWDWSQQRGGGSLRPLIDFTSNSYSLLHFC
jgi:hypothetical protein